MTDEQQPMTPQPSTEGLEVGVSEIPAQPVPVFDFVVEEPQDEEPLMDLVFLDTETTSLRASDGEIWEFAAVKVDQRTGAEKDRIWFQIECNLGEADPFSLKIGKYHERYGKNGFFEPDWDESTRRPASVPRNGEVVTKFDAAWFISEFTRGCTILGLVVSFDSERMERLLRDNFECPGWHYHVIDVEPFVAGYLKAMGHHLTLPYSSNQLTELLGVEPPTEEERHTALGDALWVKRLWEAANA